MSEARGIGSRLFVTVTAAGVMWALLRTGIPGWAHGAAFVVPRWGGLSATSVGSLSIFPFITAYVGVEFASLVVLRSERDTAAGRVRMQRWGDRLGLAMAAVQSVGIVLWYPLRQYEVFLPWQSDLISVCCLTGSAAVAWGMTRVITKHGVGDGVGVVLSVTLLVREVDALSQQSNPGWLQPVADLGPVALIALMWASLCWKMTAKHRVAVPIAGTVAWSLSGTLAGLFATSGDGGASGVLIWTSAAALLGTALLGAAFHADVPKTVLLPRSWYAKSAVLGCVFVGLLASTSCFEPPAELPFALPTLLIVTAVVVDLLAETAARTKGRLAHALTMQRPWALAALRTRIPDTPFHAGGAGHRSLLHFFGPYVPIRVLCAPEHVDAIREAGSELGYAPDRTRPAGF